MTTAQIFSLADLCIESGYFPELEGKRFVLGLDVSPKMRAIIHRQEVSFALVIPRRVWLLSGKVRVLLGDSHALPLDLASEVRPPWTG